MSIVVFVKEILVYLRNTQIERFLLQIYVYMWTTGYFTIRNTGYRYSTVHNYHGDMHV